MKRLKLLDSCGLCEKDFKPWTEKSEQEMLIRRYMGQHGHLVDAAYHKECWYQFVKIWRDLEE